MHCGFPRWVGAVAGAEDPAVVLFTSGSEAKPKGVVLSNRALLSNIAQIRSVIDLGGEQKISTSWPDVPFLCNSEITDKGTRIFIYPTPLHYRVIPELIYNRACTVLFGTPTFLNHYSRFAHPYDLFRLRYVIAGAERSASRCGWPGSRNSASGSWKAMASRKPRRSWR